MFAAWKHRRAIQRAYREVWRQREDARIKQELGHRVLVGTNAMIRDIRALRAHGCDNPMRHAEELRAFRA